MVAPASTDVATPRSGFSTIAEPGADMGAGSLVAVSGRPYTRAMKTVVLGDPPPALASLIAERQRLGLDRRDEIWEGDYHVVPGPSGATPTWARS